jgi:hypothetical protein
MDTKTNRNKQTGLKGFLQVHQTRAMKSKGRKYGKAAMRQM